MTDHVLTIGDLAVKVTLKPVKHVHLSVHPPDGRVTLVAPTNTRLDVARAYAVSKLRWIRAQQAKLGAQEREERREMKDRETHFVWGKRFLLVNRTSEGKPRVAVEHRRLVLLSTQGAGRKEKEDLLNSWYRHQLREAAKPLIKKWEQVLGVECAGFSIQKMKTKWGSCNRQTRRIRLNAELAKKPCELLDYVVLHELLHLVNPKHDERFRAALDFHMPGWREARQELNALPLGFVDWGGSDK